MLFIKKVLLLVLSLIILTSIAGINATDNTSNLNKDNINTCSTSTINDDLSINQVNIQKENIKTNETKKLETKNTNKTLKTETKKQSVSMSVSNKTTPYQSKIQLVSTVKAKNGSNITGGEVVFKINDNTIGRSPLKNSKAYFIYNPGNNVPKNYKITAKYTGTNTYSNATAIGTLKIDKRTIRVTLVDKSVTHGDNIQLIATAVNNQNKYLSSGKVAFKLNGNTIGYSNIKNGKANFILNTTRYSAKTYKVSVTVGETSTTLKGTSNIANLKILPIEVRMSVSNKSIYKTQNVEYVATVVNSKTGKYVNKGRIQFKLNGSTIGFGAVKNGKAYITQYNVNLPDGTYTITGIYSADNTNSKQANGNLKVTTLKFTYNEVKNAAVYLRNHYEANQIIKTVPIKSTQIDVYSYFTVLLHTLKNIKNNKASQSVEYVYYDGIGNHADNIKGQTLTLNEMLKIANSVLSHYQTQHKAPTYIVYNSQKFGFYNMLYSFSKMIDVSSKTYLPATCKIYNWNTIHPTNSKVRTIYISSDNILSKTKDTAFMNEIKKQLVNRGYKVEIIGLGPNTHNKIRTGTQPDNIAQLSIFGGADVGVIYDVSTRSFMRAKANRLLYFAFYPTAKDITNLSWLERAHDDNYSPSSFKGIANPDKYLRSYGYDYVYSGEVSEIVNSFLEYIN